MDTALEQVLQATQAVTFEKFASAKVGILGLHFLVFVYFNDWTDCAWIEEESQKATERGNKAVLNLNWVLRWLPLRSGTLLQIDSGWRRKA